MNFAHLASFQVIDLNSRTGPFRKRWTSFSVDLPGTASAFVYENSVNTSAFAKRSSQSTRFAGISFLCSCCRKKMDQIRPQRSYKKCVRKLKNVSVLMWIMQPIQLLTPYSSVEVLFCSFDVEPSDPSFQ